MVESQNLEIRTFLNKYESAIEGQRLVLQEQRQKILTGETACESELERLVLLATIDDLWTEYLNTITELRAGIHWVSFGGRDPLHSYLSECHRLFQELEGRIEEEAVRRLEQAAANRFDPRQRGATWTYLTTDQPLGTMTERFMRGVMQKLSARK